MCASRDPPPLLLLLPLTLLALQAPVCDGACVEVDSNTEAVVGEGFQLGCISCKMRGEVKAEARVDWYFQSDGNVTHIYSYEDVQGEILDPRFYERLAWNGSKNTRDLQDGSIFILNVTDEDKGTYTCIFRRKLIYDHYGFDTETNKTIELEVVDRLTRGMASILSEVMMYVSIVGLQLWLLVEMIYCYRKIAAAGEEALRESEADGGEDTRSTELPEDPPPPPKPFRRKVILSTTESCMLTTFDPS
ncbi:hypothetical protein OJAV_G00164630 [Oryzias javanicus]|uniref:Sodium channel regulatory subunit beta-3 n=1 Tax=Oryzias javanicus TaxID=123683 RepID=A0A437CKS4_ORYJA|nr:hypothetical protein OJAV_G00164630 [Oryzias javanicus]